MMLVVHQELKFIKTTDFRPSYIYCLPKLHKSITLKEKLATDTREYMEICSEEPFKGRPIIGGRQKVTGNLAILIDLLLKPYINLKRFLSAQEIIL